MNQIIFEYFITTSIILTTIAILLSLLYGILRLMFVVVEVYLRVTELRAVFIEFIKEKNSKNSVKEEKNR
jgi:hypothetical protein